MDDEREYRFTISTERLNDLIELTEEPNLSRTVGRALTLYYEILKLQARGYKIGMFPVEDETGNFNLDRNIVFINTDQL